MVINNFINNIWKYYRKYFSKFYYKYIMTPKEKAKKLVDKYYHLFSVELEKTIAYYEAKKCALIAVDEILEECRLERDWYWEAVKQEINNF